MARRAIVWSLLILAAAGCPRSAPAPAPPFENWYPADISLPAGVTYPCAVTALPADLVGIPGGDHRYLNHVYALVIGVVRAKQVLLHAMNSPSDASQEHADYTTTTDDALARLKAEPVPSGLLGFHDDVIAAIELHRTFFRQVAVARKSGPADFNRIPEGRQAGHRLAAAWGVMEARYGEWSPAVKDAIWHHLCALDLY